jgi:pimeloyl-ACP methyl ester carboxylesterase
MTRLLVFIPGIMGSKLNQPASAGGAPVWSEQVFESVSLIASDQQSLKLQQGLILQPSGVMHKAIVLKRILEYGICERLQARLVEMSLANPPFYYQEFSYDWRQNLIDTAKELGVWLQQHGFKNNREGLQEVDSPRLSLVCHSMGGLVAAIAMRKGFINPANVRRFITIGSPLAGAPAAFLGLYDEGYLPGLKFMNRAINWRKNKRKCREKMLETFQSFFSSYQLLPSKTSSAFVEVTGKGTLNPLLENIIDPTKKQAAEDAHVLLNGIEVFLRGHPDLKYLLIYSDNNNNTQCSFYADEDSATKKYENVNCRDRTNGDQTVPAASASLSNPSGSQRYSVVGVNHIELCNDPRIIQQVKSFVA